MRKKRIRIKNYFSSHENNSEKKFLQFSVTMYIWLIKKIKLYTTSKTISLFLLEIFFLFLSFTLSVRQ